MKHVNLEDLKKTGLVTKVGKSAADAMSEQKTSTGNVSSCGLCGEPCLEFWVTLPMPPSDNHYYTVANKRKILSEEGKEYKQLVGIICRPKGQHLLGRLEVEAWFHHTKGQAYDITNRWKALLDAMQDAGLYENDGQVDKAIAIRGESAVEPTVTVCIRSR